MAKYKKIWLDEMTIAELRNMRKGGESIQDVIRRLIRESKWLIKFCKMVEESKSRKRCVICGYDVRIGLDRHHINEMMILILCASCHRLLHKFENEGYNFRECVERVEEKMKRVRRIFGHGLVFGNESGSTH